MSETKNEGMAGVVGQDKPAKEVVEVYDQAHGSYQPKPEDVRDTGGNRGTVDPFGSVRSGR